jgi:RND family efflux transporter MFP subunit
MNTRKLLIVAAALNVLLAGALIWIWLRPRENAKSQPMPAPNSQSAETTAQPRAAKLQPVQLSPERMQSIGVTFGKVEMSDVGGEIRATGNVDIDERRLAYVQTRFAGWLRRVQVNATYQFVQKGQPLFTVYSPELVATEQEYLLALKNRGQLQTSSVEGVAAGAQSLAGAARDRLRQWEISDAEIDKLERSGKPVSELTIYSPVSGYVTERNALPNMYVQPETRLYTVADLSTVWVQAQAFQNDVGRLKSGNPAEVTVDAYPGKTFRGRVEQILPQVDMNTRTVRVRLSFANPGLLLKPGMFVNVAILTPMGKALVVPASAIVRSGARQIAFVDKGDGVLDPREVEVGERAGEAYVVRKGLKAGDRVVTSANFLVDSESQLQAAAGSFSPPPPGAGAAAAMNKSAQQADAQLTTDPNPPHKGSNIVRVKLTSSDGKPVSGAQVSVTFFMAAMPAMGMAEMKTTSDLNDKGNGLYEGKGELGSGGTWQVSIVAKQNGQVIASKQLSVSATGGM